MERFRRMAGALNRARVVCALGMAGVCNQGYRYYITSTIARPPLTILAERNTHFYASEISALQGGRGAF